MRPLRYVRKNFDYQSYVELSFALKYTTSDELRVQCVSCGESNFKLYINPEKKKFNCFVCGFSSGRNDVFDLVALTEGITRAQAMRKLIQEYTPVAVDDLEAAVTGLLDKVDQGPVRPSKRPGVRTISSLPEAAKALRGPENASTRLYWDYLVQRGLKTTEIDILQAHCIATPRCLVYDSAGKVRGNIGYRVLWPIYGGDNDLVSWQARTIIQGKKPKYIGCPESDISKTFWPYVRPYGTEVVLVEGVLDALAVRRLGKPVSAYATFSKKISREQIKLLKSWGVESVVLFWDKKDAKKEMHKATNAMKLQFAVSVASQTNWGKNLDCGDCLKREDGVDLIRSAMEPIDVDSLEFTKWMIT